jgi:ferredoxin
MKNKVQLTIYDVKDKAQSIEVVCGTNLREVMMSTGISPYAAMTKKLNCGGRGLCATCGVWIESPKVEARHWHDKAAQSFGYPRLSCQIKVEEDMVVRLVDKQVWGKRRK